MTGFSEVERDRIRHDLLEAGREYFARFGLEKTTVSELADEAGIATGSFYSFFDSKERLYLAVLEAEGQTVYGDALAELETHDDPADAIEAFLHTLFAFAEENPIFRQILEGDYRNRLVDATTEADRANYRDAKVSLLEPFIEARQDAGEIRDGDPGILALAIESVGVLLLHEDEYGSREEYERVRDTVIRLVADGVTTTE